MKKETGKKLNLSKIKIASLSKNSQASIKGGMINLSRTNCDAGGGCVGPATTNCTTHYLICGC